MNFAWNISHEGIAWRVTDVPEGTEWCDVLEAVADAAARVMTAEQFSTWISACEQGRGPDADADVEGWRWVV